LPSPARAERLVADFLAGQKERRPTPIEAPSTIHEATVSAEIRTWVARQKSLHAAAQTLVPDARHGARLKRWQMADEWLAIVAVRV